MKRVLNRWRRVGIALIAIWFASVGGIALYEYEARSDGFFVFQGVSLSIVVAGNILPLPDGKVVKITSDDTIRLRFMRGEDFSDRPLDRRELDWLNLAAISSVTQVHSWRLAIFGLIAPLVAWLLVEGMVFASQTARKGFADARIDS